MKILQKKEEGEEKEEKERLQSRNNNSTNSRSGTLDHSKALPWTLHVTNTPHNTFIK